MTEQPALTRNQSLVLDALTAATSPLSAYAILDRLRGSGLRAPLQVYRALERLTELDLVHRLESVNAFVACRHPYGAVHQTAAFAICDKCGVVREFTDATIEAQLVAWARRTSFKAQKTTIELRGLCVRCSQDERIGPKSGNRFSDKSDAPLNR